VIFMTKTKRLLALAGFAVVALHAPLAAQTPPATGTAPGAAPAPTTPPVSPLTVGPPIRKISTATAISKEPINSITGVLQLSDGRVLLNDGTRRRLLLLDSTMALKGVVLDSIAESENTYGVRPGALLAYRGDSVVFIDQTSYAMLIIDPSMKIARVRAVPRTDELYMLTDGQGAFDARGRLIQRRYAMPAPPKVAPPPGVPWFPDEPDSAFVVAIDMDTRKSDTIGVIRIPKYVSVIKTMPDGGWMFMSKTNPLRLTDDWTVTADGRVAFVRGRDYRVEYVNPDGTVTSSPKIPFDWVRLEEADKKRLVDSTRAAQERLYMSSYVSSMIRWANMYAKPYPKSFKVPAGFVLPPGMPRDWILPDSVKFPPNYIFACPPGVTPPPPPSVNAILGAGPPVAGTASGAPVAATGPTCYPNPGTVSGGYAPPPPVMRDIFVVQPEDLPDYRPPFLERGVRADADGNLWVRIIPPKPIPGGPVYDIIDPKGELVDRLQIPTGYTLVGFGKGKVVYLSVRDATGLHLARVVLK
jgi:hypothetical protein